MSRITVAGAISLVLILTPLALMRFLDSELVRLLAFVFLQYPWMLADYLAGEQVGSGAVYALGIAVAWFSWSIITYAALWSVDAMKLR